MSAQSSVLRVGCFGPFEASSGPPVLTRTGYPHGGVLWGYSLVSSPRVLGGLEESRRDSNLLYLQVHVIIQVLYDQECPCINTIHMMTMFL